MSMQNGRNLLLELEDDENPGTYMDVGGFMSNDFTISGMAVDTSHMGSVGYRDLLDGGGSRYLSTTGSGVF